MIWSYELKQSLIAFSLVLCGACFVRGAPSPPSPRSPPAPPPPPSASYSSEVVEKVELLVTGRTWPNRPSINSEAELRQYLSSLTSSREFLFDVGPRIVTSTVVASGSLYRTLPIPAQGENAVERAKSKGSSITGGFILKQRDNIFFLHKPCSSREAIKVRPWWDMTSQVLVCPDSYLPEMRKNPVTNAYCGAGHDPRAEKCGCGPNLVICARDEQQATSNMVSMLEEITLSIGLVLSANRPLRDVFLETRSARSAAVETMYRRWRILAGEEVALDDLPRWPFDSSHPTLLPRYQGRAGEHAGILTTPQMMAIDLGQRPRQRIIDGMMLCQAPSGARVDTSAILSLGVTDLRDGAGWQKLAAMPVCTTCHARLDYGSQFFSANTSGFVVDQSLARPGREKYFIRDAEDYRGEEDRNPAGFARLVTRQPEFVSCQARKIGVRFLGEDIDENDVGRLKDIFVQSGESLQRTVVEAAVLFASKTTSASVGVSAERSTVSPMRTSTHAKAGSFKELISKFCIDCHGAHRPPDFRAAADSGDISEANVVGAINAVRSRKMPKAPLEMSAELRQEFVNAAFLEITHDERTSLAASRALLSQGESVLDSRLRLGQVGADYRVMGPGVVLDGAVYGASACEKQSDRARCVQSAVDVNRMLRFPLAPAPSKSPATR